jgi:protein AFG1
VNVFFQAGDSKVNIILAQIFKAVTNDALANRKTLNFLGRQLSIDTVAGRVCMVSFEEICLNPLSAADYIQLVSNFDIIILTNIPEMSFVINFINNRKTAMKLEDLLHLLMRFMIIMFNGY